MGDAVPQIDLLPQRGPDGITFTFVAERPLRSVAVAGTFNSWRGEVSPLQRIDAGRWQTTLPIMPGRHLYKYVLDGEDWVRDPANPWVSEDGQGGGAAGAMCHTVALLGDEPCGSRRINAVRARQKALIGLCTLELALPRRMVHKREHVEAASEKQLGEGKSAPLIAQFVTRVDAVIDQGGRALRGDLAYQLLSHRRVAHA